MPMIPRLVLAAAPLVLCAPVHADTAPADATRLRAWSDDQYARLVLGARQLGRRYTEEDLLSGARRHYEELRAQYCDRTPPGALPAPSAECAGSLPIP